MSKILKIQTSKIFRSTVIVGSVFVAFVISFASIINPFFGIVIAIGLLTIPFFYILLQNIEIGILLIAFLLPFEQIGGFEIAGMNVRLSQLVFVGTFAAWLFRGLFRKSFKLNLDKKLLILIAFTTGSIISLQVTINTFRSLQIFAFIIFSFAVYFFFSSVKINDGLMKKILVVLFFSMTITCLFGLFQFVGDMIGLPTSITQLEEHYTKSVFGFPRIQSTANEPLNYANYLLLPLSVAFAVFASKRVSVKDNAIGELKNLSLPILVLGVVVMILTFSRGGWGGIAFSYALLGLVYFSDLLSFKNIAAGIIITIFSLIGIFGIAEITNAPFTVGALFDRINISDFSARHRVQTTTEGLKGWEKHKLTGIGLGAYGPYVAEYKNIEPEGGWQTVNNEYAELLIETGVIGLVTICSFWATILRRGLMNFRKLPPARSAILLGLTTGLAGMFLQYISFSTLYIFHLWVLVGIINNKYFDKNK